MSRFKVNYLSIAVGLLLIISVIGASAEITETYKTNQTDNPTSSYNKTEILEREIALNIHFLVSMLQMLDLNLKLINETLKVHLEEYPFLKPTLEGSDEGIKTVDSILAIFDLNPENPNNANVTLSSLNETMAKIDFNPGYPDKTIEAANMTMGENNVTTTMLVDMYKSVKTMTYLFNQF
jgi:hypothetical protein